MARGGTLGRMATPSAPSHVGSRRLVLVGLSVAAVVVAALAIRFGALEIIRPRPPLSGEPPVLAGRQLWGSCAGGFYARRGADVVLTSSAHCASEGATALAPDGRTVRGVFGPGAVLATCQHTEHTCRPSDMNYVNVATDQIPWGRLNTIDMGDGGIRVIGPGTVPLSCADIAVGNRVEINGRDIFRSGTVAEIGEYLHDPSADGDYFPCIVASADIQVGVGDSGGAVLVHGLPAGVTSRSFDGRLGFTPLAEGLAALGLELCTTPDCGLDPPPTVQARGRRQ